MTDGDLDAFLSLVERHRRYMYNLALRMTGNEQDAKDVVQDSLLNAYLHLEQFEQRADFRTWLHRILVNCALDHLRSRRRRPDAGEPRPLSDVADTIAASSPDPERLMASADWRRQISAAMDTMSPLERVTFAARHFEGCSISEIAQTVGIGNNSAKQHIFRAVRKLRLALEPLERPVSHLRDDDLVLHYYGEDGPAGQVSGICRRARVRDRDSSRGRSARTAEFVETTPVDDLWAVRQMLRERAASRAEVGAPFVALVWLMPLLPAGVAGALRRRPAGAGADARDTARGAGARGMRRSVRRGLRAESHGCRLRMAFEPRVRRRRYGGVGDAGIVFARRACSRDSCGGMRRLRRDALSLAPGRARARPNTSSSCTGCRRPSSRCSR
jgi:RNA polymerase sigma-70 factor (ECF subfamily)